MAFRTVIIKNRCKLEYSLNFMIVRNEEGEKRIQINEIENLIIQSSQVSITSSLLSYLLENNINVMICDGKSNPIGELLSYNGIYNSREKLLEQANISKESMDKVWKEIIKKKIYYQYKNHNKYINNLEVDSLLLKYINEIEDGDITNREGHSAKIYFNSIFGKEFSRNNPCDMNTYLDYGYTIILSAFNRTIRALGYYTELGIHHIGKTNPFNLSCDLMEPIRPLIDSLVLKNELTLDNFKIKLINVLNFEVNFDGNQMYLENAIKLYVQSVMNALINNDVNKIKFIEYEL